MHSSRGLKFSAEFVARCFVSSTLDHCEDTMKTMPIFRLLILCREKMFKPQIGLRKENIDLLEKLVMDIQDILFLLINIEISRKVSNI